MTAGRGGTIPKKIRAVAAVFVICCGLNGCLVAGYTSGEGWWVWPGSVVVTLGILVLWWLMRR